LQKPAVEAPRDRVLHERELYWLWQAFPASPVFDRLFKLLLATAQRREEGAGIADAEVENLNGDTPLWRIPKTRAKNDRAATECRAPRKRWRMRLSRTHSP
jgi:hypothetical protein